jgi:serralysin
MIELEPAPALRLRQTPLANTIDSQAGTIAANGKPIWSLDQVIDNALRWDEAWPDGGVITYSFLTALPPGGDAGEYSFVAFTETEKTFTRAALALISDIAPLHFAEAPWDHLSFNDSERIVFGGNSTADDFEWGHATNGIYPELGTDEIANAEIWTSTEAVNERQWIYGGLNFMSLMHEVLHALGLPHPGDYNADGGEITYAADADFFQDSSQYTVMSYFDPDDANAGADYSWTPQEVQSGLIGHWNATLGLFGPLTQSTSFSPATPMVHDIAALQALYGANMQTRAGDTVYGYNSTAGRPSYDFAVAHAPIFTIWDGGGIDTLDLSGSGLSARIDLGEGAYSDALGMTGNIAIAYGAQVENAKGGSAADIIIGNPLANTLQGAGGDDDLGGGGGDDRAVFTGASTDYRLTPTSTGWTVADLRAGAPDGTDKLAGVELLAFADQISVVGTVSAAALVTTAVANVLRLNPSAAANQTYVDGLLARLQSGQSAAQVVDEIVRHADETTSVASLSYQFFLGYVPTGAGFDYLVSPTGPNPNNINSAYFQAFSVENRYINFAVNLGAGGEGQSAFLAEYGQQDLFGATRAAYGEIFGATPDEAKLHALLDPVINLGAVSLTRADYFAYYGGDGPNGLGTKAAMVGWLLAEAEKADVGTYALSNHAYLTDLTDGAAFKVDVIAVYSQPDFALGA